VVEGFGLLTHGEKFKGRVLLYLLVSNIVLLHVDLGTLEVFNILSVLTKLMEGFNSFLMLGVVSSVHQHKYLLFATSYSGVPVLTNYFLDDLAFLMVGNRSTLMVRRKLVI